MNNTMFETATIGGIEVQNRIFRSATFEGLATKEGRVSPAMKEMYRSLAKGGVGMIITGYMGFSASDNYSPSTINVGNDGAVGPLAELAKIVHDNGSRIVAQISHVGSQLTFAPSQIVLGPSDVTDPANGIQPEPFTREQIRELVKEFGQAALRLKTAGFDGVQIHGAHGYLLSKFLSTVYNRRTDEYGGSPEKNVRIILEVVESIKTACGPDFPVWIKLNCSDFGREEKAYGFDDFMITAKAVADSGVDAIEVSGGTMTGRHSPCRSKIHSAYHLDEARKTAAELDLPIICVGGFRKVDELETVLAETNIAAVSMCRPLIREPGLVNRWAGGDRSDAACVACNGCFNPTGTRCFFELQGKEREAQKEVMKMMKAMRGNDA